MAQRFGIDDQPDVMCAHKARGLHHTGCAVHAHFRHQRNERVEVTPIGNAAPLNHVLRRIDILARRHALLPAGLFGGNAHGIDVARVFEIAHPEIDRVHLHGGGDFIHEGFATEENGRAIGIAQMRRAQGRRALHQGADGFPSHAIMREGVGGEGDVETVLGLGLGPQQLAGQRGCGAPLVGRDIFAREAA